MVWERVMGRQKRLKGRLEAIAIRLEAIAIMLEACVFSTSYPSESSHRTSSEIDTLDQIWMFRLAKQIGLNDLSKRPWNDLRVAGDGICKRLQCRAKKS